MIPLEKCANRRIYRLVSRNLTVGVFELESSGFIGVRTKFDQRFLFTEYHHDCGPPHGTARPITLLGKLPEEIELREYLQSVDQETRRPVAFDQARRERAKETGEGWGWYWLDTGKDDLTQEIKAVSVMNEQLFKYLDKIDK